MARPDSTAVLAVACALWLLPACGVIGVPDAGAAEDAGPGGPGAGPPSPPPGRPEPGCVHTGDPVIDPGPLTACDLCASGARCVPEAVLPPDLRRGVASCGADSLCVPDLFLETGGRFLLRTCRSVDDLEGRCVSACLPAARGGAWPASACGGGHVCVPCFDPATGEATGACGLSCDPGPTEEPRRSPSCCGGRGSCQPPDAVAADLAARLDGAGCEGAARCVPHALAGPADRPAACRSVGDLEGRCLPSCLPDVIALGMRLPRASCAEGAVCAPCFDPRTGDATSACDLRGDEPVEPFEPPAPCCEELGRCLPPDALDAATAASLDPEDCEADRLCAPDAFVDRAAAPASCRSLLGAEGRCLPTCVPWVLAEGERLPRDDCPAAHRCAPCFDPVSGRDTGACRLHDDSPSEPPLELDRCCGELGACVPAELVDEDDAAWLDATGCAEEGSLCAPPPLADAVTLPLRCRGAEGAEGRCLPSCLPGVADLPGAGACPDGHSCAPCTDADGVPTGACTLHGDSPLSEDGPPTSCCGELGTCVPEDRVHPATREALPTEGCGSGELCEPDALSGSAGRPPPCASLGGAEGRCLAECLPLVSSRRDVLPEAGCGRGRRCAPCFDVATRDETGACRLAGDRPVDPPPEAAGCCAHAGVARGRCVPTELVPAGRRRHLPSDVCAAGNLCVPSPFLDDPDHRFPTCRAETLLGPADGACVPDCLVDGFGELFVEQGSCGTAELCVPCADPFGGRTGACD